MIRIWVECLLAFMEYVKVLFLDNEILIFIDGDDLDGL
jgi:hypothetical protein